MSDDFAESFYAKMDKPEPARNESPVAAAATARQTAQDRVPASPVSARPKRPPTAMWRHLAGPAK
jgi:hypothetical protein